MGIYVFIGGSRIAAHYGESDFIEALREQKKLTDGSRVSHNRVLGSDECTTVTKSKVVSKTEKVSASMKLCSHGR